MSISIIEHDLSQIFVTLAQLTDALPCYMTTLQDITHA